MAFTALQTLTAAQLNDLDITTITTSGDGTIGGDLTVTGTLNATVSASGSDGQIQYNNGGAFGGASGLHYDDGNARLGIGTTSPAVALHVDSGSTDQFAAPQIYIAPSGHASSDRAAIQLDDIQLLTDIDGNGDEDFSVYSNNAAAHRLSIDGSGNVGINDTTPSYRLDVNGTGRFTGTLTLDGDLYGTSNTNFFIGNDSNERILFQESSNQVFFYVNGSYRAYFQSDGDFVPYVDGTYDLGATNLRWAQIHADSAYIDQDLGVDTDTLFVDASADRVGINDSTPSYSLDVNGTLRTTGSITNNSVYSSNSSQSYDKVRVWTASSYSMGMRSGINYGGLGDYAMTFRMNSDSNRGFWWGDTSHSTSTGAMSLTTTGRLVLADDIRVGFGESDTSVNAEGYAAQFYRDQNNSAVYTEQVLELRSSSSSPEVCGMAYHIPGYLAPVTRIYTGYGEEVTCNNYVATAFRPFGGSSYVTRSSERYKTNIRSRPDEDVISTALDVLTIPSVTWDDTAIEPVADPSTGTLAQPDDYTAVKHDPLQHRHFGMRGLIAEDVAEVLPAAAQFEDTGECTGIKYDVLVTELLDITKLLVLQTEELGRRLEVLEA